MPLIEARNLRKVYTIHEHQATTLKELALRNFFSHGPTRRHVALDDVSFQLEAGQSLGVIGPNGSGKSTLLKLIAGITPPTSGSVEVRGRVVSLLELGAGFQPEFTGMENIFLQGRILGLSRPEILRHLDEIIEFSGLGPFVHTPTKRYSTGMTVRLGFAIAAYFDADLLLIDEVLAVGDAAFQTRCLDRIADLKREGKSILLVSHDLNHIERAAEDVLWIERGAARMIGPVEKVIHAYERSAHDAIAASAPATAHDPVSATLLPTVRQGTGEVLIREIEILRRDNQPASRFLPGECIRLALEIEVVTPLPAIEFWVGVSDLEGNKIVINRSGQSAFEPEYPPFVWRDLPKGRHRLTADLEPCYLPPGHYLFSFTVNPAGKDWDFLDMHLRMHRFQVSASPATPPPHAGAVTPSDGFPLLTPHALVAPPAEWEEEEQV